MQRKMVKIGVAACVLALVVGGLSIAQQAGGGGQGGGRRGGGQGGGGMRGDPAQMRQMMMDRMKEQLGVKDDAEWKVMQPRLTKVMELNQQVSGGGRGGMMGMMGGRGGRGGQAGQGGPGGDQGGPQMNRPGRGPQGEPTALDKTITQLDTVLQKESASPEEIKTALTAVRQAREKAEQELTMAQQDLKKILTLRQEAMLVRMGQLR
ncbi:MAG: hypothetical protein NTZ17_00530 [Phycisphaerae bacterium]|nr:hypothetical protein [Phycisphaerae bacterium]